MPGHTCYHCKQWVADGEAHDCWTTTEAALTQELSPDLRDAWERIRETAADFGEQRIYASHNSIMFARKVCYCFVRPKRTALELVVFLGRPVHAPQVRRVTASSRTKFAHTIPIRHRDEVEAPITDWMEEAYAFVEPTKQALAAPAVRKVAAATSTKKPAATSGPRAPKQARKAPKPAARPRTRRT